ncbi:MAG: acyltransferase [Hungatella sp.]|jgi:surface polysaccharide O-acyltransferase-like enzyme|nr:acyltransferase [Hungatella sp.]
MQIQNKRIIWLDASRALAISLVILTHATDQIFIKYLYGDSTTTLLTSIIMYTFFTLGRLGVPIFLFITGSLLLKRNYLEKDNTIRFFRNNLLPLFLATIFWIFIYNLFDTLILKKNFSLENLILELLFIKRNNMPHMWYMYMILGLYLAIPFIATIVNNFPTKIVITIGIIPLLYSMLLPSIIQISNLFGINISLSPILDLSFLGGCYGVYCITGFYISNNLKIKSVLITPLGVSLGLLTIFIQAFSYQAGNRFNVWYDFIFLYFCAVCLMLLMSNITIKNEKLISLLTFISRRSLALYFVHMPVRFILIKYLPFSTLNAKFAAPLFFITVYCVSLLFIFALEHVPFIRKWIFLIK